jgi:hypothetical protein
MTRKHLALPSLMFAVLFVSHCWFVPRVQADLVIMNSGDSISANSGHRSRLQFHLNEKDRQYDFVGDRMQPGSTEDIDHQAFGGMRYRQMLEGWTIDRGNGPAYEPGVADALTRHTPNLFLIMGGYNDMVQENVGNLDRPKQDLTALLDHITIHAPESHILLANITDFDPTKTWGHKRQNVLDFNPFIEMQANTRDNVTLVDNFSLITYDDLNADGLHIAASGHVKIGDNWMNGISAIPEPSSACGLAVTCLLVALRRNRHRKRQIHRAT